PAQTPAYETRATPAHAAPLQQLQLFWGGKRSFQTTQATLQLPPPLARNPGPCSSSSRPVVR
ncbi:hypothetical protein M9458_014153, partial [Cirrhinus mrigala]